MACALGSQACAVCVYACVCLCVCVCVCVCVCSTGRACLEALLDRASQLLTDLLPQHISNILLSLAKLGHSPSPAFIMSLGDEVCRKLQDFAPQARSTFAHTCIPHPPPLPIHTHILMRTLTTAWRLTVGDVLLRSVRWVVTCRVYCTDAVHCHNPSSATL